MRKLIIATALMAIPSTALAQDIYQLDPAHTQVTFSVDRFGFTTIFGSFGESGGTVSLDMEAPENSSVTAWVDTASVALGNPVRDQHVAGTHWLDAEANPRLTFASSAVEVTGEDTARVTGELTLWGEAREVTLDVHLNRLGTDPATRQQAAGFTITGTIDRSDWGHQTAAALIGQEVAIRIEALGHLQAGE